MTTPPLGLLFAISVIAGFVGAMAGMGGGIVLIPALTLMGMDIKHAIAISIVSVIATSSGSAAAYVKGHMTNLKVGMFLEMFTILGGMAGASLTVVSAERPLFIVFGLALLFTSALMFSRRRLEWKPVEHQDRLSHWLELEGNYFDQALQREVRYRGTRAWLGGPLMFGAGLLSGLLGVGAGAVKVVIQDLLMGLPPKVSTTTSNLIIGVTALAGTSVYLVAGLIDPGLAVPVILGVLLGAFIGTRILVRISNRTVHGVFTLVLLALGLEMTIRGLWGTP